MAFQLIDSENVDTMPNQQLLASTGESGVNKSITEPIYENMEDEHEDANGTKCDVNIMNETKVSEKVEPHYQVPRSREPYYEIPKKLAPIPLYENVELMFPASSDSSTSRFSMAESTESFGIDDGTEMVFPIDQSKYLYLSPPKEKPPPPPPSSCDTSTIAAVADLSQQGQAENFKRINSTKRIKKEIRNKRSSFLGIDGQDFDEHTLELSVAPPPNIQSILQEEKRLEKQLYQKVGLYQNADNGKNFL
jgi:F-box protein 20